jgi:hypothetical protein
MLCEVNRIACRMSYENKKDVEREFKDLRRGQKNHH